MLASIAQAAAKGQGHIRLRDQKQRPAVRLSPPSLVCGGSRAWLWPTAVSCWV
jgi:hypothetical protein